MDKTVITARGWLADYLHTQMTGLTGHMAAAGFPFDREFWGNPDVKEGDYKGVFWWPFEQTAYHIDGQIRAAIVLGDKTLVERAAERIYRVILHPDEDGYLGPKQLKIRSDEYTRWPHVIFFRACLALYEYNGDERIVSALVRHYLAVPFDYSDVRNVYNVEILVALYGYTGQKELLMMAEDAFCRQNEKAEAFLFNHPDATDEELSENFCAARLENGKKMYVHGVSYHEYAKLGAILYRATGKKEYLRTSVAAYRKLFRYYMLPSGANSSTERLRSSLYNECTETCDVADMTWALENLFFARDDADYGDRIERCAFNAGVGCVTEDFRALQYFSCANQLILDDRSSHAWYSRGNKGMRFAPNPMTACCPGNVNRVMPNYVLHTWQVTENAVTAKLYGPCRVTGTVNGQAFAIEEKTRYPFDLSLSLSVKTKGNFRLRLRIPAWCTGLHVDRAYKVKRGYAEIEIAGDTAIAVTFDAAIRKEKSAPGVYFTRGPLVYSLGMRGNREITETAVCDGEAFPTYRMTPDKKWNFAFLADAVPEFRAGRGTRFDLSADLPTIRVAAREVPGWKIRTVSTWDRLNWKYEFIHVTGDPRTFTPNLPRKVKTAEKTETITLVPYGAAKVRMTVLPEWKK